tara:strand:+ start:226 stop:474 length:249 start_codon:yes stop_codon:yes gene_type:complete
MELEKFVREVVCSIVDDTENILIEEDETIDGVLLFKITVSKDDVGKLIGKGGRIASAIRTVLKAAGAKRGRRVSVNVMNTPL